jgi:hypothetical protein
MRNQPVVEAGISPHGISENRVPEVIKVLSDLVAAARHRPGFHQTVPESFKAPARPGFFVMFQGAEMGFGFEPSFDFTVGLNRRGGHDILTPTTYQRLVNFLYPMLLKGFSQVRSRLMVEGKQQHTGGGTVQPMDRKQLQACLALEQLDDCRLVR